MSAPSSNKKTSPSIEQTYGLLLSNDGIFTQGAFENFQFLDDDERRLISLALRVQGQEGVSPKRQAALKSFIEAYKFDYAITKAYMSLRQSGVL